MDIPRHRHLPTPLSAAVCGGDDWLDLNKSDG
jgi:hypothetical protein